MLKLFTRDRYDAITNWNVGLGRIRNPGPRKPAFPGEIRDASRYAVTIITNECVGICSDIPRVPCKRGEFSVRQTRVSDHVLECPARFIYLHGKRHAWFGRLSRRKNRTKKIDGRHFFAGLTSVARDSRKKKKTFAAFPIRLKRNTDTCMCANGYIRTSVAVTENRHSYWLVLFCAMDIESRSS